MNIEKELKIIKFTNGEEILGEVTLIETNLKIKHPVRVLVTPQGLGFASWIAGSADIFYTLKTIDSILLISDPAPEVKNAWNQQFGSGIVVTNSLPPQQPTQDLLDNTVKFPGN